MNQKTAKALRRRAKEDFMLKNTLSEPIRYKDLKKNYKKIKQGKAPDALNSL
jgi:hypothetical protein